MNNSERLLIKVNQASAIVGLDINVLKEILNKYEILASVDVKETDDSIIFDNAQVYATLLLPIVYRSIYNIVGSAAYNQYKTAVPKISKILEDTSRRDKFFGKYGKMLMESGVAFDEYQQLDGRRIEALLSTFGLQELAEDEEGDILDDDELDLDLDLDDILEASSSDEATADEPEENDYDKQVSALKEVWGDKLEVVINGIMATYRSLYESGYGLVSPCGVLTNVGAVRSTTDGRIIQSGNKALDIELFRAITSVLSENFNLYAQSGEEPDIFDIERAKYPIIYVDMHLRFMFGHIRFCKGISKYLKDNNIENDSTTKVIKWSSMSGYIRETIESYFYDAYIKYGVTTDASDSDIVATQSINQKLSNNLKNVIVVAERKKGVNTRVRIATDSTIDVDRLLVEMQRQLNVGTDNSIAVKQIGKYNNGVVDINVVYNEKKFSQDSLFAYQVLDILEEQGIRPRWDNVILGKKDDGTIMTYNFKDRKNPVYGIYAATGSGKGVMTLNLIASAIADLCKVLYIDGKPDMGNVLADLAWTNGCEAAVYNGVSGKGCETLEGRGTSIRRESPFMDEANIPDGIFLTADEKQKFMLITTYLRGIELICDTAAYRSSQGLSGDDWVTAFVDECEQASVAEIDINQCLNRAETSRKAQKDENGKRINLAQDPAYLFIQDFRAWQAIIKSKFKTCITSTFRYSNMTVMFIWQSTQFPEKYKNDSVIASVIDGSSGVITKIVGRGAAVPFGSRAFGTPTSLDKVTWYDNRFSGQAGGYFAIGKDVNSDNMSVFRPFNIYSDANHKDLIVENAKAVGLTEDDLKGVSLDNNGNVIPEVGFEGYITKMLSKYGITAPQQLSASYEYFNTLVQSKGVYRGVNEFMFNCHIFNAESGNKETADGIADGFTFDTDEEDILDFGDTDEEVGATNKLFGGNVDASKVDLSEESSYNKTIRDMNTSRINEYRSGVNAAINARMGGDANYGIFEPEITSNNHKVGVTLDNGRFNVTDTSGFDVIQLDKSAYIESDDVDRSRVNSFMSKLMDNRYGMNYNFSQRWKCILDSIAKSFPRTAMVVRVQVLVDVMLVNNRIVNVMDMIDDGYGIMLEDIVNYSELLRRFPNIKELTVDQESFKWMTKEYCEDKLGIYKAFAIGKHLERILVNGINGDVYEITRDGRNSDEAARRQAKVEFKHQLDQISAGYNNNVDKKGSVYAHRISDKSFGFTKTSWGKVKNNYIGTSGNRHIIRGTLWLGVAAVTGVVGSLFWGGSKLMKQFGK